MAGERDWLTAEGAKTIAEQIEKFWKERGAKVKTYIENHKIGKGTHGTHTGLACVRSNMVNGLPHEWRKKQ